MCSYIVRNIFEWYGKFRNGRESVDDDPRMGNPLTNRIPEHIAKVRAALVDVQHSTIRMLATWFHINKETVCKIIMEDLVGKSSVRDLFPLCRYQNNKKIA